MKKYINGVASEMTAEELTAFQNKQAELQQDNAINDENIREIIEFLYQIKKNPEILSEHLIWVEENLINELISFLEEKLGSNVIISRDKNFILIGLSKTQELSKRTLKVYIKRFLHKYELLDRLRVISGDEDSYIIHKRRGIEVTRF